MLHLPTQPRPHRGDSRPRSFPSERRSVLRALHAREEGTTSNFRADIYTGLLPSNTFVGIQNIPKVSLRRFTPCGRYLITISDNLTDIVVFRLESGNIRSNWRGDCLPALSPPARPFDALAGDSRLHEGGALLSAVDVPVLQAAGAGSWPRFDALERHTCAFQRFFTRLYESPVAAPGETLARDFCLVSDRGRFLILASCLPAPPPAPGEQQAPPDPPPALRACPLLERFSLYLVEARTGRVYDRFVLEKDYVHLDGHPGVHIRRNLLLVLSLRTQTLYLLRVQEGVGRLVRERVIGPVCRDDDEHELLRAGGGGCGGGGAPPHAAPSPPPPPAPRTRVPDLETGLGGGKRAEGPYTGLMQRLLAYVFRKYAREGNARKFFRVLAQYSMLVMLKAQLLDDDHVLVQLGSDEGGKAWDIATQTCFYLVYCVSSSEIVNLFENKSVALLRVLESHHDLFVADPAAAAAKRRRNTADELAAQIRADARAGSRSVAFKKVRLELSRLPVPAPMRNSSPYLDRRLYSYDMSRLDHARDGRPVTVKLTSVRTETVRLRLAAGVPVLSQHLRMRGAAVEDVRLQAQMEMMAAASSHRSFLFHPILPFAISIVTAAGMSRSMNFHVIGHTEDRRVRSSGDSARGRMRGTGHEDAK